MLARAEEGGRDHFPASARLAVNLKCSEGRVWMQEYDGAAHSLGFSQTWRTAALAGNTQPFSEVILPPAFQLFRVSDAHLLGVVTDDMDLQRVASIPFPQSLRRFVRDGSRPVSGHRARNARGPRDYAGRFRIGTPEGFAALNRRVSLDSFRRRASCG